MSQESFCVRRFTIHVTVNRNSQNFVRVQAGRCGRIHFKTFRILYHRESDLLFKAFAMKTQGRFWIKCQMDSTI